MNRRTWIAGVTVTAILAVSLTACKQERKEQETGQTLPVMVVSSQPIEFEETYSASIRGRQDVDIIPQVSGRIIRLCVKEGEQVKTGQVLAVIDQAPYQAALRIAIANVSAAQAKVETARIELNGKQSLFDEKVISDYELSVTASAHSSVRPSNNHLQWCRTIRRCMPISPFRKTNLGSSRPDMVLLTEL